MLSAFLALAASDLTGATTTKAQNHNTKNRKAGKVRGGKVVSSPLSATAPVDAVPKLPATVGAKKHPSAATVGHSIRDIEQQGSSSTSSSDTPIHANSISSKAGSTGQVRGHISTTKQGEWPSAAATKQGKTVQNGTGSVEVSLWSADPNVFEGDIIPDYVTILKDYGPDTVQKLEKQGMVLAGKDEAIRTKQADINRRWDNRVNGVVQIPYSFSPSGFDDQNRAAIDKAVRDLGDRSHVVKFVPRTSESDYILVLPDNGCYSYVGKQGGEQALKLNVPGCMDGAIQHEFLHALGFNHEQSRPDRDNYVKINYENIQPEFAYAFDIAEGSESLESPYDYNSVMHYGSSYFAKEGAGETITAPQPIGQRGGADDEDILQVILLYQCTSRARTVSEYNANPCSTDCLCWEGAGPCNGDDSCQGDLVCSGNQCVQNNGGGGETGSPGGLGSWYQPVRSDADPNMCLGLYRGLTDNANPIMYYGCDSTHTTQMWFHDGKTSYIRNGVDPNKCLIGNYGSTETGTRLVIHDCLPDDTRFKFNRYTDGTIRPQGATGHCIGLASTMIDGSYTLEFGACGAGTVASQQWTWYN